MFLFIFFMTTNRNNLYHVYFLYFLFYHDTYGMKYTHFIEEEGELYRILPLLDI